MINPQTNKEYRDELLRQIQEVVQLLDDGDGRRTLQTAVNAAAASEAEEVCQAGAAAQAEFLLRRGWDLARIQETATRAANLVNPKQ